VGKRERYWEERDEEEYGVVGDVGDVGDVCGKVERWRGKEREGETKSLEFILAFHATLVLVCTATEARKCSYFSPRAWNLLPTLKSGLGIEYSI
jgi:hypothetical protein